jgi:ankyrin repeat protein
MCNMPVGLASACGNTLMVKMLLEVVDIKGRRADPSAQCCFSLRQACENGHHDVINLLDDHFTTLYPDRTNRKNFYQSQYDEAVRVNKTYRDAFARLFDLKV